MHAKAEENSVRSRHCDRYLVVTSDGGAVLLQKDLLVAPRESGLRNLARHGRGAQRILCGGSCSVAFHTQRRSHKPILFTKFRVLADRSWIAAVDRGAYGMLVLVNAENVVIDWAFFGALLGTGLYVLKRTFSVEE
jgi:hypothetical protein